MIRSVSENRPLGGSMYSEDTLRVVPDYLTYFLASVYS